MATRPPRANAGDNSDGRLGIALGNTTRVTIPVPVASTTGVTSGWAAVSAGGYHTCAIAESTRAAYCWGAFGTAVTAIHTVLQCDAAGLGPAVKWPLVRHAPAQVITLMAGLASLWATGRA